MCCSLFCYSVGVVVVSCLSWYCLGEYVFFPRFCCVLLRSFGHFVIRHLFCLLTFCVVDVRFVFEGKIWQTSIVLMKLMYVCVKRYILFFYLFCKATNKFTVCNYRLG